MGDLAAPSAARALFAKALFEKALVARGATRLATALFLGSAGAALALATLIATSPTVARPGDSRDGLLLAGLVGAAAALATWGGTGLQRREALTLADRELGLGGLLEAAVEGADGPGPFQGLLEGEVRRRVRLRSLRGALDQPWGLALLGAAAALWCLFAAADGAKRQGEREDRRRLLGRAAADLAAAAAGVGPGQELRSGQDAGSGQELDLDLARLARRAESAARTGERDGAAELAEVRRELAELARRLDPTDPAAERVESARLALGSGASAGEAGAAVGGAPGQEQEVRESAENGVPGGSVAGSASRPPGSGAAAPDPTPRPSEAGQSGGERAALAAPPRAGKLAQEASLVARWVAARAAADAPAR